MRHSDSVPLIQEAFKHVRVFLFSFYNGFKVILQTSERLLVALLMPFVVGRAAIGWAFHYTQVHDIWRVVRLVHDAYRGHHFGQSWVGVWEDVVWEDYFGWLEVQAVILIIKGVSLVILTSFNFNFTLSLVIKNLVLNFVFLVKLLNKLFAVLRVLWFHRFIWSLDWLYVLYLVSPPAP